MARRGLEGSPYGGVPITDPKEQGEGRAINLGISVEVLEQFQVETSGTVGCARRIMFGSLIPND